MSNLPIKIFISCALALFLGISLAAGGVYFYFALFSVFGVAAFYWAPHLSYLRFLQVMIGAFFLLPIGSGSPFNLFNFINPLTFLGVVLLTKSLLDKITLRKGPLTGRLAGIDKIYFLFLLSAVIASFFAESKLGAFNWIFYSVVIGYVPFKVIVYIGKDALFKILHTFVIFGVIVAIEGLTEYFLQESLFFRRHHGRLTSLLGHPLVNGLIFSILFPYCFYLYAQTKKKAFLCCALLFLVVIALSGARGSWFAIIVGALVILFLASIRIKIKMVVMTTVIFMVLGAVPLLRQAISSRLEKQEDRTHSSWDIRLQSIPIAFEIFKDKPLFGGGPFNSGRYKNQYATDIVLRHTAFENSYLGFLIDFGILGCFFLGGIFIIVFLRVFLATRNPQFIGLEKYYILWSLIIMYINFSTFNFNDYRSFSFIFFSFAAIAYSFTNRGNNSNLTKGFQKIK